MWIQVALFVASLLISSLLQPKQKGQKPAAFEDFDFPTAEDGTPQIVVFGDVWLTDWTVIGVGNYRSKKIKVKQKGLLGSKEVDAGYKYFMGIHFGLSNAIDDIVEIKVADKSIWKGTLSTANLNVLNIDQPQIFGGDESEGGIVGTLWVMRGASDQQPLPQLQKMLGNDVPAYRGVATAFFDGQICSNSPYPKAWSLRVRRTNAGWDGSIWYPEKLVIWLKDNSIKAMNAAHIIYEAQTNRTWGRGFSESQLDLVSFKSVADQLYSEGFGICLAWRRQESLQEFIQQIIDQIGAAFYVDRTTGLWKLILIRDNYDASTLPSYDYSTGLLRVENDDNSANDLVTNQTIVTYRDPISNEDKPARAENLAAIQKNGVILENKTYVGIPTVEIAGRIAARDMKIAHSALKRFKVVLDRRAYALQPAAVFKLSLPERGIESMVFRAIRVEHNDLTNGEITVTALQDVFGLPATNYLKEQPSLWQPPSYAAKPVIDQIAYEVTYTDLLNSFSALDLATYPDNCYVGVIALQPSNLQLDYQIWAKKTTEAETYYQNLGNCDFNYVSSTIEVIQQSATTSICVLADPIDQDVEIGTRALLGNEIVRIQSINITNNSIVVGRGYIDTVPMLHPVGTKFAVYNSGRNVADQAFKALQAIDLKLLTRTSQQQLTLAQATKTTFITQNRKQRPYAPANVKLNDQYFPEQIQNNLNLKWSHRNRLNQTEQMNWTEFSQSPENGTVYNLKISDRSNTVFVDEQTPGTSFDWNIPKRFDGEMTTVLNITMNGPENSQTFTDTSPNNFPILNDGGVLIKSSTEAQGGSHASFGVGVLKTTAEYPKLDIYKQDHCIEFRVKTAPATHLIEHVDNLLIRIRHERQVIENIGIDYNILLYIKKNMIGVDVNGKLVTNGGAGETAKTVSYTANNLDPDTYYDIAIQSISIGTEIIGGTEITKAQITIFLNGEAVSTDVINLLSWDYPCSLVIQSDVDRPASGAVVMNGFRITKKLGGRYNGNYTPQPFITGTSDPLWNDVVLYIPMTGISGNVFTDVSNAPVSLNATDAVMTRSDTAAHGGSAAHFYYPILVVAPQPVLNLRDKSFTIEGRINGYGEIFRLSDSMALSINQYTLVLHNEFESTPLEERQSVSVFHGYGTIAGEPFPKYINFKIMRDGASGNTMLWIDDIEASGQFNPAQTDSATLLLGMFSRDFQTLQNSYFNGFKIETVGEDAVVVPNVNNPIKIELSAQRDGLDSYQTFSTEMTVI
ncbi:hypothetical protein [Acinetobacter nematophilus]|uniref:Tip attachment protein J domain-containing protein n=1 Tax=Acinetobacter nematophilus TaxID=2994642 RepID=A0A9X3DR36_9GAMM|nr:hypothetical protein [Acinetobacter nematophilus]MCX5466486.1 hypothetical protein [Acinetobacter nematophilus]